MDDCISMEVLHAFSWMFSEQPSVCRILSVVISCTPTLRRDLFLKTKRRSRRAHLSIPVPRHLTKRHGLHHFHESRILRLRIM